MSNLPLNFLKKDYELYDDFSTSTWVATNSNAIVDYEVEKNITGTKSLKLTTNTTALGSCTINRSNVNFNFLGKSKQMMIKVWVEDTNLIDAFIITLGNSDWSKFFNAAFYSNPNTLRNGWNYLTVIPSTKSYIGQFGVTYGGGFTFSEQVQHMQITLKPKTDKSTFVIIDSIWLYGEGIPKILLTFDDGWKTVYQNAFPIMKELGIKGTVYAIPKYSSPDSERFEWFCNVDEFREMYEDGWCIGNHTYDHTYYFSDNNTPETYSEKILQCADWIKSHGLGDGAYHVCYPNGEHPDNIKEILTKIGMKTGRTTRKGAHPNYIDDEFRCLTRGVGYIQTLEEVKSWVDLAIENGGTTFFMFHQIPIDDTSTNGRENPDIAWSKDKFVALMHYIAERGAVEYCVAQDEWWEGMKNARYSNRKRNA